MMKPHKQWVTAVFDRASPEFGEKGCSYFNFFAEKLVKFSRLAKNEKVLDAATGKGAVLSAAARILGSEGQIAGIDISPKMLQEAKKRVPAWVELKEMDAEHLAFPDHSFDVVFCAFAIYFFPDVQAVLSEFKRVLKPDGRMVISSFGKRHTLSEWTYNRTLELGASQQMLINPFNTMDSLKKQFEMAKLRNIETHAESTSFTFETPQDWWDSLWSHGMRAVLEQLTPSNLELLRKEAFARAKEIFKSEKIKIEHQAIFISAKI